MNTTTALLDSLRHQAHIWFVTPENIQDSALLASCYELLDEHERARHQRFYFEKDRHRYLVSHALVRRVLSGYADIPPADWHFSHAEHGRPEITNRDSPPLRFNLTHTAGLAACVVTLSAPCGIDAEKITPRHHPLDVAKRMFSETEYRQLESLQGRQQLEYFFACWTLREAYVKAIGIGISFPTRKLLFSAGADDRISIDFADDIDDHPENWQFDRVYAGKDHVAAVALGRNDQADKQIIANWFEFVS